MKNNRNILNLGKKQSSPQRRPVLSLKPLKNIIDTPELEEVPDDKTIRPKIKVPSTNAKINGMKPVDFLAKEPKPENNFWFYTAFALILIVAIALTYYFFYN